MKLDINEIYHNYIIRVVVFSLFLHKRQIRQPNVFRLSVLSFVKKRIPWKIELRIDTGIKLNKEDEREILLQELLDGVESDYLTTVTVTFMTPLKETTIMVDLKHEHRYEKFLYL
jgi:hypothetical protein